jgi:argininosuccinate synthase
MHQEKNKERVVLAFSGGLDTSFCVPYLIEQGYEVFTLFVDSGGVSLDEKNEIKKRALSLGASKHHEANIANDLWNAIITPFIWGGFFYQQTYPLLCSDRYLIVEECLALCQQLKTKNFAHGCTGMGNDQVRFDLSASALGDFTILSPIRDIQKQTHNVRAFEQAYLQKKGFSVSNKASLYSVNENLLGTTISGSEIDEWKAPSKHSYLLTPPVIDPSKKPQRLHFEFEKGTLVAFNGQKLSDSFTGAMLMKDLNHRVGAYSIGRGIYTGDTCIGLKGRIVFEAPALFALHTAHMALEQTILSKAQNRFKTTISEKWTELLYEGFYYDPLKKDLESFLHSSQQSVTGDVVIELTVGSLNAIEVHSPYMLKNKKAIYAQSASWTSDEAIGFIKLFGQSTIMACQHQKNNPKNHKKISS